MELKTVFEQIQAAEAAGNLSPEEKKRLEEQAAEKGLQALFKVRHTIIVSALAVDLCLWDVEHLVLQVISLEHKKNPGTEDTDQVRLGNCFGDSFKPEVTG